MNGKFFWLALALGFLAPSLALAQADPEQRIEQLEVKGAPRPPYRQMDEDIEILRRILNSRLVTYLGFSEAKTSADFWSFDHQGMLFGYESPRVNPWTGESSFFNPYQNSGSVDLFNTVSTTFNIPWNNNTMGGAHPASHNFAGAEGNYLKGYGVVYSVTLPIPPSEPRAESPKPAAQPLSQWERTRKELRGEKVETVVKNQDKKTESLTDALLKILAENGRHFSQLAESENVTVAVTFRGNQACTLCHAPQGAQPLAPSGGKGKTPSTGTNQPAGPADPAAKGNNKLPNVNQPASSDKVSFNEEFKAYTQAVTKQEGQSYSLLGDLHLKQGKAAEAITAFETALKQSTDPKEKAQLYTKIAQAFLLLDKKEQAVKALQQSTDLTVQALRGRRSDSQVAAAPSMTLPAKLVLSVPKKLLDQVGAGKISFEDFKKLVSQSYSSFDNPRQGPAEQRSGAGN